MNIFQKLCYVEIETVSSCTRKCPWCLFGAFPDFRPAKAQYLDTKVIHNVFSSLKQSGFKGMIALFSINEPLLDERILNGKLIRDCKTVFQEQVLVELTTNGDLLTPTVADMLFGSGLDILKISCYTPDSYHNMLQFYGGDGRITVYDQTRFQQNEYESNRAGTIDGSFRQFCGYGSCSSPFYRTAIGWDGEVRICFNDILQQVRIGNVYDRDFAELLSGAEMTEMRETIYSDRQKFKPCCYCNVAGDEQKMIRTRQRYLELLTSLA
jgi:MoaA/NifB/PqqE/SkfB family radical SAM enzyme